MTSAMHHVPSVCVLQVGVIEEIHSSANSCVVIWKVARFRQLNQPTYSFDFRTPQNRVLHLRIDPRVRPCSSSRPGYATVLESPAAVVGMAVCCC